MAENNATGVIYANSHTRTLDLALMLHPGTKRLFVISGTLSRDKSLESIARDDLRSYQDKLEITYLTDVHLPELISTLRTLPPDSIALYVWQQALSPEGTVLESRDIIGAISAKAAAPIYGLSFANVGNGIVGGYVYTYEGTAAKLAKLAMRVTNGSRAADIPVEHSPVVPMFDWRQLQKWNIPEDRLPAGSIIKFRELTAWQVNKWRFLGGAGSSCSRRP